MAEIQLFTPAPRGAIEFQSHLSIILLILIQLKKYTNNT
jgi:hypothetical protein